LLDSLLQEEIDIPTGSSEDVPVQNSQ